MAHVNTFANIPITVVPSPEADSLALAKTLLHELQAMLATLLATGQGGSLDLRALPALGEEGYRLLKDSLGIGEVNACIQSFGRSQIQETAYPGIWWVSHYNQDDEVLTEVLEVSFLPELLRSPKDDVASGLARFGQLVAGLAAKK